VKGKDLTCFITIVAFSTMISPFVFDENFDRYSDLITFLSIMIGFTITSLATLYNSPIKKILYRSENIIYKNDLLRIKAFFGYSILFEMVSVLITFIFPEEIAAINFLGGHIVIGRYITVLPILTGTFYFFYRVFNDLMKIFSLPINY
jgi:hypothetical protein